MPSTNLNDWSEEKLLKADLTEMPKLNENQIKSIINKWFKGGKVKESDAKAIYDAQQASGISALALMGIAGQESGYGKKAIGNNLWGWGATNDNPTGNAKKYDTVGNAFMTYAKDLKSVYYDKRQAKSIYAIGTGENPSGLGYAYTDGGQISKSWAYNIGTIMRMFALHLSGMGQDEAFTQTGTATGTASGAEAGSGTDVNGFIGGIVKFIAVAFIGVLAVIFMLGAFDVQIPTKGGVVNG